MKIISATIAPLDCRAVRAALELLGVEDADFTEVKVGGPGTGRAGLYRGAQYLVDHVPQVKVEVAVEDDMVACVIDAIERAKAARGQVQYVVNVLMAGGTIGNLTGRVARSYAKRF